MSAAVVIGLAALVAWLALAPPGPDGAARGAFRACAALLLLVALLDLGCSRAADSGRPRLALLVDRSLSMTVAGDRETRAAAAETWLAGPEWRRWTAGWRVETDSFGGTGSDPGAAIAAAAASRPDAIVIVSDGRAAGGRAAEPVDVPLFAYAPGPIAVADAAIEEVDVTTPEGASPRAVITVAAVGGRSLADAGSVEVTVDGRALGRAAIGPLAAGERRTVSVPLPREMAGERIVEARRTGADDAAAGNDRRARVWEGDPRPRRVLVVGLRPGWDMAAWRRALEDVHPAPVDVVWAPRPGALREAETGRETGWSALDPGRIAVVYLFGDPALLGSEGGRWLARLLTAGGRGLLWNPGPGGGRLEPAGLNAPAAGGVSEIPVVTTAGDRWLTARGVAPEAGPDGRAPWPPLEALPAGVTEPPPGAVPLLAAGGRPIAWAVERGTNRVVLTLGTGWYRWPLETGAGAPGAADFWAEWTGTVAGWLAAATPAARPLVRRPPAGRVVGGGILDAPIAADVTGAVAWRVEGEDGPVAEGTVAEGAVPRSVRTGRLAPGRYALVAASGDRRARFRFVVEDWAPDLAWTAADTASLGAAARASGGALLAGPLPPLPRGHTVGSAGAARRIGFGTTPWIYLVAALLLLADWALGSRRVDGSRASPVA